MVRLAWHASGTYRVSDGRGGANGGTIRLTPLNAWPDNTNLDKARRLLWPLQQKYNRRLGIILSWADLIVLTGTVALQDMGCPVLGFGFGRKDNYTAHNNDVDWGPEKKWLDDQRHGGAGAGAAGAGDDNSKHETLVGDSLNDPLGAVQMGLIYVNPEGPGGNPDPLQAAHDIRTTFTRMAMNDEETVALIAGGHTFGKAHGAAPPNLHVGPDPEGAPIVQQGLGWKNSYGTNAGNAADTITSGLEGAWTAHPTRWDTGYLDNLFGYEWKQTKSPAGATQWIPTDTSTYNMVPDAHDASKRHAPIMFTADLALRYDPVYGKIARRFHQNPGEFQKAFAAAWYKLTHKDMGPRTRLWGPYVPPAQLWQDPVPVVTYPLVSMRDVQELKQQIMASSSSSSSSGLLIDALVRTAWASASTFRATDCRGGANGARLCLAPQNAWPVNDPTELALVLSGLKRIQLAFNTSPARTHDKKQVSLADLIVLGGCAAIEAAAHKAGHDSVSVPFVPGRTDATVEQTDVESFDYLKPIADGFRNWVDHGVAAAARSRGKTEEQLLVDKAYMLKLSAAEMTVLVGGMRVLGANTAKSPLGVLTDRPQVLSNDFFVNLLDMNVTWHEASSSSSSNGRREEFIGKLRGSSTTRWRATRVDLIFGSHSELRAIAEYYACDDAQEVFVRDFVAAWTKVMNNDRFDIDPDDPGISLSGNSRSHSRL